MNLKEWKQTGEFFKFKDFPIFYQTSENDGETLLCLHGFPTSSFDYHKVWNALGKRFSLVSFDMIGYGFSAKPFEFDYTTFQQVDILQSLVDHLEIKELHILAHDYGNTSTQELLARKVEARLNFQIKSICFLNGALFPETHRPILAQKILLSPIGSIFARLIPDRKFKQSLASIFGKNSQPNEQELEDFLAVFKNNGGQKVAHKLIRYMKERAKYRSRWVGALESMKQPFRFINGLADPVSGAHLVERFRTVFPQYTDIIELDNIGHFPHFEVPDIFLYHFMKFHDRISENPPNDLKR